MAISLFKKNKKAEGEAKKATKKTAKRIPETALRIGLTLLISEKALAAQQRNQVVFKVVHAATKGQVAQAVEEVYKVKPLGVRTVRMSAKPRRRRGVPGWTRQWKKAYVAVSDIKPFNLG